MIADQTASDVARDRRDDDFLPRAVVRHRADDDSGPEFCCRLIREDETNQDDVASVINGHRRNHGYPTAQLAPDRTSPSRSLPLHLPRRDLPEVCSSIASSTYCCTKDRVLPLPDETAAAPPVARNVLIRDRFGGRI